MRQLIAIAVVVISLAATASPAPAGLLATGDVTPAGPATWTSSTNADVGNTAFGSVSVDGGSDLLSQYCQVGHDAGVQGEVTVTGPGSTWTNADDVYFGFYGDGTLNITDSGLVEVGQRTYVAWWPGSTGAVNFDNGTLTTGGLLAAAADLSGTGTINTNGLVSDVDLLFDATHPLVQTSTLNDPGQNITVNLDVDGTAPMGAGYDANGSLHIADGMTVQSTEGQLGYRPGSSGSATVTGPGSTWDSGALSVGRHGNGTLNITAGGAVNSGWYAYVGHFSGSTGAVTVDGSGSTWINSGTLYVGDGGDGTLDVTAGGTVSCDIGYIARHDSTGVVTVDGAGSTWTMARDLNVGGGRATLNITNGGQVTNAYAYIEGDATGPSTVLVAGPGSTWTNSGLLYVGNFGDGSLTITNGGTVTAPVCVIAETGGFTGVVTVDGAGSTLICPDRLNVAGGGQATLNIFNGGTVRSGQGMITPVSWPWFTSVGAVTVDGVGSTWACSGDLSVGGGVSGTMTITNGGLVTVGGELWTLDHSGAGEGYINMSTDGMLALWGDEDDSIADFLNLFEGTDDLRYWNGSTWDHIINATPGVDYTLAYHDAGALAGHTVLTVPEPATMGLLAMGGLAALRRRKMSSPHHDVFRLIGANRDG